MKKIAAIGFLGLGLILYSEKVAAQGKLYATTTGQTSFHSSTPAEDIRATNQTTQVLLNTDTGELAVLMNMRDFDFPNELMEEHFNENYIESAKYPKATFKGKLDQLPDFSRKGSYELSASGTFTVHGASQPRTLKGTLTVEGDQLRIESDFDVSLADHQIKIPKIVFVKIAQVVQVKARYLLTPYSRK